MNHFLLIPLLAALGNVALAGFVWSVAPRRRTNQVFGLWGLAIGVWNFGAFVLFKVKDAETALVWARITNFAVLFLPAIFLHLCVLLTRARLRFIVPLTYAATIVISTTAWSELMVRGVRSVGYAWFAVPGPVFLVFCNVVFPAVTLPALVVMVKRALQSEAEERRKYTTLAIANSLLAILGAHDLLPVLGHDFYPGTHWRIYPWGTFCASLYGLLVGYGVLQDQLLDMRVALGRRAATLLRVMFLLAMTYLIITIVGIALPGTFSTRSFVVSLLAVAISVLASSHLFPRILVGQSERLERRIIGDRFEVQTQMLLFAKGLLKIIDAEQLAREIAEGITTIMRMATAEIVIMDGSAGLVRYSSRSPQVQANWQDDLKGDGLLFRYLRESGTPIVEFSKDGAAKDIVSGYGRGGPLLGPRHEADLAVRIGPAAQPVGVIVVGGRGKGRAITIVEREILLNLVEQIGHAIDRIRLAEQAQRAERQETLRAMAKGINHDLNNLLMPIAAFLQDPRLPALLEGKRSEMLGQCLRSLRAIREHVHAAQTFGLEMDLKLAELGFEELLAAVGDATDFRSKERGVALLIHCDDAAIRFTGDKSMVERSLINVVANAIDASAHGKSVHLTAQRMPRHARGHDWVRFIVRDEGCGIPPDHLSRIFQPYFTTKDTGNSIRGSGLGLTIVQRFVNLHGGEVSIASMVDKGTTVQIDLPGRPTMKAAENSSP